jgi:uncharacterized SAM-binding protein YcdF (DUF218 family)
MNPDQPAKILWDYLCMHHPLQKADCIIGMGSYDMRIAERAADLFLEGWAPFLVFSGGRGRLTPPEWITEADVFAEIAIKKGVPAEKIIRENQSTNTGENVTFTKRLLEEKGIVVHSALFVHKSYMERRAYATFRKQWPELKVTAASPMVSFEDYPIPAVPKEEMINVMVGDLQRIKDYPAKGFQIPQEIPADVEEAFEKLTELGFTKYLV